MKVYQVNVVCGSGSTGKIAVDLAETIKRYGGESRIAYGRGNAPENVDSFKISNRLDLYFHAAATRITDKHGLYSKGATKRLIADIKAYQPDIIHLHNIHGYYVNYEMLFNFLKAYGKPVVWTLHDCWTFTGHCAYFDYVDCEKWKKACYACPQKSKYPISILKDNSRDNFERKKKAFTLLSNLTVVTVSEWLKKIVKESFLNENTVVKISNGIDLKKLCPVSSKFRELYHLNNKKILLGVASVWDERKGLASFFELEKMLPEEYQIVLIGLNSQQKTQKPKNILAIDKISDINEMAKWYTVADVFVNTSVEETMGLTTVEAMACGTPVVVMNTTASPELVPNECGMVVDPGNLEQLKNAVTEICKNEKVSAACIAQAGKFEKNQQYRKYLDLYEKLMFDSEQAVW